MWSIERLAEYSFVRQMREAFALPRHALLASMVVLGVMGATTGIVARWYHEERTERARYQSEVGDRRAAAGAMDAALDHYRAALALERDDRAYRRAVALSLVRLQRFAEAGRHLDELLEQNPVDAEANLLRARLAVRRGLVESAEAYYQRAIYGRWPERDEREQRLAARFELLAWLEQIKAKEKARAELVRLQAEIPDTIPMQRELARHFIILDQPIAAVEILRKQLTRDSDDPGLARELMTVALSAGRLEDARLGARRLVTLDPSDKASRLRLEQLTEALTLDPTRRRLSTATRVWRSGELLTRVVGLADRCTASTSVGVSAEVSDTIVRARELMAIHATLATRNTLIEERIATAEALWNAYDPRCRALDEPLGWVFEQLQQN